MATATKKNPYIELESLEAEWTKAKDKETQLGRELKAALELTAALHAQRETLAHREPSLVDHHGNPGSPDNPVGLIDAELAKAPDPNELAAKREHARKLTEKAKERVHDHIATNFAKVVEAFRPDAEKAATDVADAITPAIEATERYLAAHSRATGLTAPVPWLDGRNVPGIDSASELLKALRNLQHLPTPIPPTER
jgi:hypothetical protein